MGDKKDFEEKKKTQVKSTGQGEHNDNNEGEKLSPPEFNLDTPIQKQKAPGEVAENKETKGDNVADKTPTKEEEIKNKVLTLVAVDEQDHMSKFVITYLKSNSITDIIKLLGLDVNGDIESNSSKVLSHIYKDFIDKDDYSSYDLFGEDKKGKKLASEYYGEHNYHKISYTGNWKSTDKSDTMRPGWGKNPGETKDAWIKRIQEEKNSDYKKARKDEGRMKAAVKKFSSILKQRKANLGDHALLEKDDYNLDKKIVQEFLTDSNNFKEVGGKKLYNDAADSYTDMEKAATADGISLKLAAGHRKFSNTGSDNTNAKAKFSVHHLRNAIDLKLNSSAKSYGTETSTSPMNDVRDKRSSPVHKWMVVYGKKHGWYPFTPEPWHWEYNPPGFQLKFKAKLAEYILANGDSKLKLGDKVSGDVDGIKEGNHKKKKGTEKLLRLQLSHILNALSASEDQTIKDKLALLDKPETTDEEKLKIINELLEGINKEEEKTDTPADDKE